MTSLESKFLFVLIYLTIFLICPLRAVAQSDSKFDINLLIDVTPAEQTVQLIENKPINTLSLAELRGNRIAASTTGLIANQRDVALSLKGYLDSLKYRQQIKNDVYNLEIARKNVEPINELLTEIKKRSFNRKVVATIEQVFPRDAEINLTIPIYVVALGHENVDAYVRRIIWHGNTPQFVGENDGELTIVMNLTQSVRLGPDLEERYISLLCIVAHEVFHAAFSTYKENSSNWKKYYSEYKRPFDELLDLTMNEGIAYYLTLDQRGRGYLPRNWNNKTREAFQKFNESTAELLSDTLTYSRAFELIRQANLSGYWESYGSITGMFIAREIDLLLGREKLIETISFNPYEFFKKYVELSNRNSNLPTLNKKIIGEIQAK